MRRFFTALAIAAAGTAAAGARGGPAASQPSPPAVSIAGGAGPALVAPGRAEGVPPLALAAIPMQDFSRSAPSAYFDATDVNAPLAPPSRFQNEYDRYFLNNGFGFNNGFYGGFPFGYGFFGVPFAYSTGSQFFAHGYYNTGIGSTRYVGGSINIPRLGGSRFAGGGGVGRAPIPLPPPAMMRPLGR